MVYEPIVIIVELTDREKEIVEKFMNDELNIIEAANELDMDWMDFAEFVKNIDDDKMDFELKSQVKK